MRKHYTTLCTDGQGDSCTGSAGPGPLPGMTRSAPALARGKSFCRRGGGARRRAAAGAAHGWGMGGAARRKNGPLPGGKRGGRARRQMRRGGPAVRQRVCQWGGREDSQWESWSAGGVAGRGGKCAADGLPCGKGSAGRAAAGTARGGGLAALHGAKRPAAGRPCAAANALRTACRAAWGKWVSPAKAAPHGAKTACCRAALRCGKRAADGLPCGKGFACGSGCPARFPASGVASPLQDAAGRERTDRRRPNGSSALAT